MDTLPLKRDLTLAYRASLLIAELMFVVSAGGIAQGSTSLYGVDQNRGLGVSASTAGVLVPGLLTQDVFKTPEWYVGQARLGNTRHRRTSGRVTDLTWSHFRASHAGAGRIGWRRWIFAGLTVGSFSFCWSGALGGLFAVGCAVMWPKAGDSRMRSGLLPWAAPD